MNQLYGIERRATQKSDQERGELRAKESRRILDRLGEYLEGPVAKSVSATGAWHRRETP